MTAAAAVAVDALVWTVSGAVIGAAAARLPAGRFARDGSLTRIRPWERWERVGVARWKDHLPELGSLFGGMPKRSLAGHDTAALERFMAETRRAELVHWVAPLPLVAFPLWNPWWLTAVMAGYAFAANVPFVVVQRYNRARAARVVARRLAWAVP